VKLRTVSRLAVITLVVVVGAIVYFVRETEASTLSGLQGTRLGGTPAPDFRLTDQLGRQITLAQLRGHPVVLTFLYTRCLDECPMAAEKVWHSLQKLGTAGNTAAILAVSVDPQRDDQMAAQAFSRQQRLLDRWHYLLGTRGQLAPVWAAYGVSPTAEPNGQIAYQLGLYLIDKQGREQAYLGNAFTPDMLAADLRILASA
jgi:protein SCO1